jgi:hypothetical protein
MAFILLGDDGCRLVTRLTLRSRLTTGASLPLFGGMALKLSGAIGLDPE